MADQPDPGGYEQPPSYPPPGYPGYAQQPPGYSGYGQPGYPPPAYPPPAYPPPAYPPPAYPPPAYPQAGWSPPAWPPGQVSWATGTVRYGPGAGIAAGLIGLVCVALSLFALDWAKGGSGRFSDLRHVDNDLPDGLNLSAAHHLSVAYAVWAAFVLFGLAVVLTLAAGLPVPRTAAGNTFARIAGALVAGLGATGHVICLTQSFKGPASPEFGAWLGLIGWFVVAIGFVFGARRLAP